MEMTKINDLGKCWNL